MQKSQQKQLLRSAYSDAKFFLAAGPMIGFVVLLIFQISARHGLDSPFVFLLFTYYFGAVPAFASGFVFGLAYQYSLHKRNKASKIIVVLAASVTGVAVAILFFQIHGISNAIVPAMAVTASVICSILRFRDIDSLRKI